MAAACRGLQSSTPCCRAHPRPIITRTYTKGFSFLSALSWVHSHQRGLRLPAAERQGLTLAGHRQQGCPGAHPLRQVPASCAGPQACATTRCLARRAVEPSLCPRLSTCKFASDRANRVGSGVTRGFMEPAAYLVVSSTVSPGRPTFVPCEGCQGSLYVTTSVRA